jgi:hypothetical protein
MEDVGVIYGLLQLYNVFCGKLAYLVAIWYIVPIWVYCTNLGILYQFGYIVPILVYCTNFGILYQEKSGNPRVAYLPRPLPALKPDR